MLDLFTNTNSKKDFFSHLIQEQTELFNNCTLDALHKKLNKNYWEPEQLKYLYKLFADIYNIDIIEEFIVITESIQDDISNSPFILEWVQSYFKKLGKNFYSRYYWPHRWALDTEAMIEIYNLLAYIENYDNLRPIKKPSSQLAF